MWSKCLYTIDLFKRSFTHTKKVSVTKVKKLQDFFAPEHMSITLIIFFLWDFRLSVQQTISALVVTVTFIYLEPPWLERIYCDKLSLLYYNRTRFWLINLSIYLQPAVSCLKVVKVPGTDLGPNCSNRLLYFRHWRKVLWLWPFLWHLIKINLNKLW